MAHTRMRLFDYNACRSMLVSKPAIQIWCYAARMYFVCV